MHKSPFDIATLLYKHKTGSLTQESEIEQLREWISASSENENLFNNLSSDCSFEEYSQRVANYNVNDAWNNLLKKKQKQKNKIIFKTYLRYAASIALIIGISVGSFIWYKGNNSSNTFQSEQIVQNKIVPGKSKAILTLPTGEQIALEDENTLISDRIAEYNEQTNTEAISFSTIETPQGGEYRLKLSDGSHISLNSQSKVRFPDKFPPDKREIELLQGEVFLDVIPSTNSPFTVKMKDMTVKVTGTSFNISTYEQVYETTLVSGSVEVSLNTGKTYRLRPSQQLSNKAGNSDVIIKEVDTDLYTSWVDGRIVFKDESIENIMNKLARWYNFKVEYDSPTLKKYKFGVNVNKYDSIEPVLKILGSTNKLQFVINGDIINIKEGNSE